ncbi:MAG: tRNA 4-thiouridine(8) synthase ThiI [Clostridia bacterium]|nr:tRNA 4-thiouridine(8) synthase ThiI [Clostridia bacterium]
MTENVILIRYAEIHLKGLNRPFFERKLEHNIRHALHDIDHKIRNESGRIYAVGISDTQLDTAAQRLTKVFGVHSVSIAVSTEKSWESVKQAASELMSREIQDGKKHTFKVFAKRADKKFPMTSEEICRELGHELLESFDNISVDIHTPEIKVGVEIRDKAIIYTNEIRGAGGLPVGTSGRAALLLSGGIDSPVAGYMIAKRGVELSAVHFFSYPYTSERAKDKVIDLAKIVSEYAGEIRLHVVPFTEIQLTIHERCPEKETTLLMRRLMMKISQKIAEKDGALALITGESIGQVASQTVEALCCTDDAVTMPVFRPCIGMDKMEITEIAKRINTFETSIIPEEDCCTVFVPKHPVTKPVLQNIRESESLVDFEDMIEKAIADSELIICKP